MEGTGNAASYRTPQGRIPLVSEGELEVLLRRLGCPMGLHEIRALILGCLAHADGIPMDRLHRRIWQGIEPDFRQARQVGAYATGLAGLWEALAGCRGDVPVRLTSLAGMNASDVARRVRVRMEEVHAFVSGLRLVPPSTRALPAEVAFALGELRRVAELLERVGRAAHMAAAYGPEVADGEARDMGAVMAEMESMAERAMAVIVRWSAVREHSRAAAWAPGPPPHRPASVVLSRGDPCPCGSAFPVGDCCRGRARDPT